MTAKLPPELVPPVVPMKKVEAAETPPVAEEFKTVMLAAPGVEISLAGIVAVNCLLETNVVLRGLPFHCTIEAVEKFVPLTFRVSPGPAATAELGVRDPITGALGAGVVGVVGVGGGVTVNGGAGLTKLPATKKTWPPLVLKAKPF